MDDDIVLIHLEDAAGPSPSSRPRLSSQGTGVPPHRVARATDRPHVRARRSDHRSLDDRRSRNVNSTDIINKRSSRSSSPRLDASLSDSSLSPSSPSSSSSAAAHSLATPPKPEYFASISGVLASSSRSPDTPSTPGPDALMTAMPRSSPIEQARRRPRYHHSSDTPLHLRGSPAFPSPSYSHHRAQQSRPPRVRFSPETRSMPRLVASSFTTPFAGTPPAAASTPLSSLSYSYLDPDSSMDSARIPAADFGVPQQPTATSSRRRRSTEVSTTAASTAGSGSWQRKVAEEMVRLSGFAANTSNSSGDRTVSSYSSTGLRRKRTKLQSRRDSRSSGEFGEGGTRDENSTSSVLPFPLKSNDSITRELTTMLAEMTPLRPRTNSSGKGRTTKESLRTGKPLLMDPVIANYAAHETIHVRVAKQESFDDPHAIRRPWQLEDLDLPTPSLGFSDADAEAPFQFRGEKKTDSEEDQHAPIRPLNIAKRRKPRSRASSSVSATRRARVESQGGAVPPPIPPFNVAGPSSQSTPPRPLASTAFSASSPSLRAAARRQASVKPSVSLSNLAPPATPPRPQAGSLTTKSSPEEESPAPSRHRLSAYTIEPAALFFSPRAHPPEGYEAAPSTSVRSSSYMTAPESSSTPRAEKRDSLLVPGQVRLVSREDLGRDSDAASTSNGKGKNKRLSEDPEPVHLPTLLGVEFERPRVESTMTKYTDDDVLGELPVNPRKKMKLSASAAAALAQPLSDVGEASGSRSYSQASEPSMSQEPRSILRDRKHASMGYSETSTKNASAELDRTSTRRSHSVSFTLQGSSVFDTQSRRSRRPMSMTSLPSPTGSIPLMAFIAPRPASIVVPSSRNATSYHLREPRRYSSFGAVPEGSARSTRSQSQSAVHVAAPKRRTVDALPFAGWAFFVGFLLPFFWWAASFASVEEQYTGDVEHGSTTPLHTYHDLFLWRRRCRLMTIFSILVYTPVIALAVIFGR